ncbi:MAG: hypothetical protein AAB014_02905 [Nitrospirota bacterium]
MEWVNLIGFFLVVSATLVGLGSFVATCGNYKSEYAGEVSEYEEEDIQIAA